MTVDERNRLQLAEALKRVLGDSEGITLMELLPPVGWADVATRHDLLALEARIDLRFDVMDGHIDATRHEILGTMERELRTLTWRLYALNAASTGAFLGALVAVVKL